jgi:hypothetical protein
MKKSEREAGIAYHEAGHAVSARVLGVEVTYVSLFEAVTYHQRARDFARNDDLAELLCAYVTDAMVVLAGPIAQCRYYRQPKERETLYCSNSDLRKARRLAARLVELKRNILTPVFPEPKYDELFAQLCDKTRVSVNEHWPAIERVANGRRDIPAFDGAYVDDLIAGRALKTTR